MSNEAKRIIRLEYGDSPHPITRNIEGYRIVRQANGHTVAVEISRGSNMENGPLWGASFAVERPDGTTDRLSMLSDCFRSKHLLNRHIAAVGDGSAEDMPKELV